MNEPITLGYIKERVDNLRRRLHRLRTSPDDRNYENAVQALHDIDAIISDLAPDDEAPAN